MDHRLLDIVACPICHNKLFFNTKQQEFICKIDRLAYPIRDGIPVLLDDEARKLTNDENII